MKITQEQFYKEWKLSLFQQIKTGNKVLSEVEFALPKESKNQVWRIMNNGQADFDKIIAVAEEFDLDIDSSGLVYRLTKIQQEGGKGIHPA